MRVSAAAQAMSTQFAARAARSTRYHSQRPLHPLGVPHASGRATAATPTCVLDSATFCSARSSASVRFSDRSDLHAHAREQRGATRQKTYQAGTVSEWCRHGIAARRNGRWRTQIPGLVPFATLRGAPTSFQTCDDSAALRGRHPWRFPVGALLARVLTHAPAHTHTGVSTAATKRAIEGARLRIGRTYRGLAFGW